MAFFLVLGSEAALAQSAGDQGAAGKCEGAAGLTVLPAPLAPWKGAPLRVVVTAEKPFDGALSLIAPDGSVAATSRERHGGPPYFWYAEVASPAPGTWRARIEHDGAGCTHDIAVSAVEPPPLHGGGGSLWPIRASWNRATEDLFSAWIEKMFDAPLDQELSWPALHLVLRDRSRNFLFNYLGLGEDQMGMVIRPDCADLPYFLRAYFAFKMGLPFGYSKCSRGGGGHPPMCVAWSSIQRMESGAHPDGGGEIVRFKLSLPNNAPSTIQSHFKM